MIVAIGDLDEAPELVSFASARSATLWLAPTRQIAARLLDPAPAQPGPAINVGDLSVDLPGLVATYKGHSIELTRAEVVMLAVMARRPGHVYSFAELTEAAWASSYLGDSASVRSAIKRLRKKLLVAGASVSIESARGSGFKLIARDGNELAATVLGQDSERS